MVLRVPSPEALEKFKRGRTDYQRRKSTKPEVSQEEMRAAMMKIGRKQT